MAASDLAGPDFIALVEAIETEQQACAEEPLMRVRVPTLGGQDLGAAWRLTVGPELRVNGKTYAQLAAD